MIESDMGKGVSLVCPQCGELFSRTQLPYCDQHGDVPELAIDEEVVRQQFDPETASRRDIWRYDALFPVDGASPVTIGEGWTDIVSAPTLGQKLGVDLTVKREGANPTGSTKDRGSSVLSTFAVEQEITTVGCASTGNAAASMAAYAARAGLACHLFVPHRLPEAKGVQPLAYGADVTTVDGNYGDACRRCREVTTDPNWIDRTAGATPFVPAGARTLGYELAEQTPAVPEWVVISMGNGGTLAAAWKGWQTFASLGFVDSVPRFLGVQTEAVSPIYNEYAGSNSDSRERAIESKSETTCADSIAVPTPHRGEEARNAVRESDGTIVRVSDEQIQRSIRQLGRCEGVFAEPASAATIAGIERAREEGTVDAGDRVVAVITGTGLKDTDTARQSIESGRQFSSSESR